MFTLLGELILVDFRPGHFPYDEEITQTFFPNRQIYQSDKTYWYGVVCSEKEWESFMDFAEAAIRADENPIGTDDALDAIAGLRAGYAQFKSNVTKSPFKRPTDWNRMVA